MTADLEQMRRNVQVLDLMTESFEAHARGDLAACDRAIIAANECDAQVVSVITGGMTIGEIPNPERDGPGWAEYVSAQREALARTEAEASPPAPRSPDGRGGHLKSGPSAGSSPAGGTS